MKKDIKSGGVKVVRYKIKKMSREVGVVLCELNVPVS